MDATVEIGPGQERAHAAGCGRGRTAEVVEIDRDLAALLRNRYADQPRFVLHEPTHCKWTGARWHRRAARELRLIGNCPTTFPRLLFQVLQAVMPSSTCISCCSGSRGPDRGRARNERLRRLTVMLRRAWSANAIADVGPRFSSSAQGVIERGAADGLMRYRTGQRGALYGRGGYAAFGQRAQRPCATQSDRYLRRPRSRPWASTGARRDIHSRCNSGALAQAAPLCSLMAHDAYRVSWPPSNLTRTACRWPPRQ